MHPQHGLLTQSAYACYPLSCAPKRSCPLVLLPLLPACCLQIVMGTFIISFIGNSFIVNTIDNQVRWPEGAVCLSEVCGPLWLQAAHSQGGRGTRRRDWQAAGKDVTVPWQNHTSNIPPYYELWFGNDGSHCMGLLPGQLLCLSYTSQSNPMHTTANITTILLTSPHLRTPCNKPLPPLL